MANAQEQPLVTIGIPTLNREAVLVDTIKTVLAQDYQNFEIIIADQTSSHPPEFETQVQNLNEVHKNLRYFLISPKSLPAARNFIVDKAKGSLVLFLDDDVVLKPDFISRHVALHQTKPEYKVVVGRIIQSRLPQSKQPLHFDKYGLPQGTFNSQVSTEATMINGANLSIETDAIKAIGGFCTAYKGSAIREESDAGYRLVKAGYRIYYSGNTGLVHLAAMAGGTRIHKPQFDDFGFYVNDLLFALRTVKARYLPVALFKRLRIYSGGSGLLSLRRLKRTGIFVIGLLAALWRYFFLRRNFTAKEIGKL